MLKKKKRVPIDANQPMKHPRTDRGDRKFDKTQLKIFGPSGNVVHRDYAAHWFRWGFASRFVKQGHAVLDVGCGQEQPLIRILGRSLSTVPRKYVGIDYNAIKKKLNCKWAEVHDRFDFTTGWSKLRIGGGFDVITCFEVIEHMSESDGDKLLIGIRELLNRDEGVAVLSTPVYNEHHMAANHIREYRYDELKNKIAAAGLRVRNVFGTFMTSQKMKRCCTKEERKTLDALSEWYGWDVLACFLAPLYPRESSNCCWVLESKK